MTYIGTTVIGLEKASCSETKGIKVFPGRVEFSDYKPKKNYLTLDKIYKKINSFKFKTIKDVEKNVEKLELSLKGTYYCKCVRQGKHDFNSTHVEQIIGKAIGRKNKNLNYSKIEPENKIIIDLIENDCTIGKIEKEDLSKREYRIKLNNQTIPALIAANLIKYLKIKPEEKLCCLNTKDGIISIEANLAGIKNIIAQDSNTNNIRNAKINAKMANAQIKFTSKNEEDLDIEKQDFIIAHLIYSRENKKAFKKIYDTFKLTEKILKNKLAIITNHPEDLKKFKPDKLKEIENLTIKHKKATSHIVIYE